MRQRFLPRLKASMYACYFCFGIEAQGKMVEHVDLDDKKEERNEVEDDMLASTLAITTCMVL